MQIREFSPKQFEELKKYWLQLENGKDMTVFQHYGWFKNINELYFKEHVKKLFREWKYFVVLENDKPLLIAPVMIIKFGFQFKFIGLKKGAYFIGRKGFSDYLNFIYDDFSKDAIDYLFNYLKETCSIKYYNFERILEDTKFYKYLSNEFKIIQTPVACATLTLPENFEDYKKLLTKSTRQNIRTAINRQKRDNINLTHEFIFDFDTDIKKELLVVREERLGKKQNAAMNKSSLIGKINLIITNIIEKLFSAKHDIVNECYNPWCFLIKDGNEIAGYFWGISDMTKKVYYVILAGVREKYYWYSPSVSHLYLFLEEYFKSNRDDISAFDFTRGGERYKFDMGGQIKNCWCVKFKI